MVYKKRKSSDSFSNEHAFAVLALLIHLTIRGVKRIHAWVIRVSKLIALHETRIAEFQTQLDALRAALRDEEHYTLELNKWIIALRKFTRYDEVKEAERKKQAALEALQLKTKIENQSSESSSLSEHHYEFFDSMAEEE